MINLVSLFSRAICALSTLLNQFQIKRFLPVLLVGFLLLTTNTDLRRGEPSLTQQLGEVVRRNDSDRPKTTGEWQQEARETEGAPGERLQRVAKESAEAVKDFGSLYPDTAERSTRALQENGRR